MLLVSFSELVHLNDTYIGAPICVFIVSTMIMLKIGGVQADREKQFKEKARNSKTIPGRNFFIVMCNIMSKKKIFIDYFVEIFWR